MTRTEQLVLCDDPTEIEQLETELGLTQEEAVDQIMTERWREFPAACGRLNEFAFEDKRRALLVNLASEIR